MATGNSFDGQKSVKGSEEDFHIVCLPCHRDGETMAAYGYCCQCKEHLCASCFKYHKRSTPTRHHKLLDKDEMPDTQDLDATVQPSPSDNLTSPCPDHKNEMLKFYCHDHKLLLCGICVALEHSKQCKVAYIPDISEYIINSQEYEKVVERINKVLTECASIKDKTSEDAENSNSSLNEGIEDIRMLRQKINDKFDKMEEDIGSKMQALKQQNEDRQEEDESICNDVIKRVTVVSDSLNQLNASKQADLLFVELKQSLNQLQEYEDNIRLLSTKSPIRTYKFVPSSMISEMLQSEETLGDLTALQPKHEASTSDQHPDQVREQTKPKNHQDQTASTLTQQQQRASTTDKHSGQARDQIKSTNCQYQVVNTSTQQQKRPLSQKEIRQLSRSSYDNIQTTRHGEMYVMTFEDWKTCSITGMTSLPSGKLVLVDNRNSAIKLVDINTDQIISRLSYHWPIFSMGLNFLGFHHSPWSPWTITATSSTQVAVTVPDRQEIQFITATDKLSLTHKVKTNGKSYGICYFEDILVVTYENPWKLEIMNMQGKVITSVQKNSTGEDIFSRPGYVQANSNHIYVSDRGKKQVIMLNWKCEVTGRIGGLGVPEGLTLLHDGSLLVCDWWGDIVYHVSGDCTNKRAVLQGVSWPRAICVDDGGHTLYISRWSMFFPHDDINILVYKL